MICKIVSRLDIIVGVFAMAFHGAPRFTGDIDNFILLWNRIINEW
jgi:hypothetical protein